jgi:hypothetical protein
MFVAWALLQACRLEAHPWQVAGGADVPHGFDTALGVSVFLAGPHT